MSVPSQTTTSLTFSWTQPLGEVVDTYMISLDYQGDCTDFNPQPLISELAGDRPGESTEVTFGNTNPLQEFSDYTFIVTAVNLLGSSTPTSTTAKTLPSGTIFTLLRHQFVNVHQMLLLPLQLPVVQYRT